MHFHPLLPVTLTHTDPRAGRHFPVPRLARQHCPVRRHAELDQAQAVSGQRGARAELGQLLDRALAIPWLILHAQCGTALDRTWKGALSLNRVGYWYVMIDRGLSRTSHCVCRMPSCVLRSVLCLASLIVKHPSHHCQCPDRYQLQLMWTNHLVRHVFHGLWAYVEWFPAPSNALRLGCASSAHLRIGSRQVRSSSTYTSACTYAPLCS
jgi:hypothetical protein